jgi:probable F420-dependent oxidoreductase
VLSYFRILQCVELFQFFEPEGINIVIERSGSSAKQRFQLGIGASSPVVVGDWNSVDFTEPFARSRDMLRFLKLALAGEMVNHDFGTFALNRFRLERPPATPPQILLAALRPGMLRLAAAEADGVILNWLSAADVTTALAETKAAGDGFDVAARIFVCPTDDVDFARNVGRRMITSYLTVPAYAAFHRWLGREEMLTPMWRAWSAGDRKGALAAIPDQLVDDLIVHGTPAECRAKIQRYFDNGVTTSSLAIMPLDPDLKHWDAVRSLAPTAG